MKVITLLNEKGGVGKTTVATHLAAGLAIRGHRVLLIDTDAQDANATDTLGVQRRAGIYNLLVRKDEDEGSWERCLVRVPENFTGGEHQLWLVPSNAESHNLNRQVDDLFVLQDRLDEVSGIFDIAIIDSPPSPGLFSAVILASSDYLIIPTELERASAGTAVHATIKRAERNRRGVQRAGGQGVEVLSIVPNKYRSRTDLHNLHLDQLVHGDDQNTGYGEIVWGEPIPNHIVIGEAAEFAQSLFTYQPTHATTELFWRFIIHVEKEIGYGDRQEKTG